MDINHLCEEEYRDDVYSAPDEVYAAPEDVYTIPDGDFIDHAEVVNTPEDFYIAMKEGYTTPIETYMSPARQKDFSSTEKVFIGPLNLFMSPEKAKSMNDKIAQVAAFTPANDYMTKEEVLSDYMAQEELPIVDGSTNEPLFTDHPRLDHLNDYQYQSPQRLPRHTKQPSYLSPVQQISYSFPSYSSLHSSRLANKFPMSSPTKYLSSSPNTVSSYVKHRRRRRDINSKTQATKRSSKILRDLVTQVLQTMFENNQKLGEVKATIKQHRSINPVHYHFNIPPHDYQAPFPPRVTTYELPAPPGCRTLATKECHSLPVFIPQKVPVSVCQPIPDIDCVRVLKSVPELMCTPEAYKECNDFEKKIPYLEEEEECEEVVFDECFEVRNKEPPH